MYNNTRDKRGDSILYRTHIVGGLAMGYVVFNNVASMKIDILDPINLAIASSGLILGSLLPDIDHKNSFISNKTKPLSIFTSKIFKHRGFTHSILGSLVFYLVLSFLANSFKNIIDLYYLNILKDSLMIGFISHILLDLLTSGGVVLFYPLINKRVRLVNMKKDEDKYKILDYMVFVLSILIILAIYIYREFIKIP